MNAVFGYDTSFVPFGRQHLVVIGITVFLCLLLPFLGTSVLSAESRLWLGRGVGLCLSVTIIAWTGIRIYLGDFDPKTDLPLDICNLAALLMPLIMWTPNLAVHEILYFWVLSGTVQALLTPHLEDGFPRFTFLKYWIAHAGVIILVIYYTVVFQLHPGWGSMLKAFLWLQAYLALMFLVNYLLGSNYFYIMEKPQSATLLDYLGPWPWYIVSAEALVLVFFTIVYLPLYFLA